MTKLRRLFRRLMWHCGLCMIRRKWHIEHLIKVAYLLRTLYHLSLISVFYWVRLDKVYCGLSLYVFILCLIINFRLIITKTMIWTVRGFWQTDIFELLCYNLQSFDMFVVMVIIRLTFLIHKWMLVDVWTDNIRKT